MAFTGTKNSGHGGSEFLPAKLNDRRQGEGGTLASVEGDNTIRVCRMQGLNLNNS